MASDIKQIARDYDYEIQYHEGRIRNLQSLATRSKRVYEKINQKLGAKGVMITSHTLRIDRQAPKADLEMQVSDPQKLKEVDLMDSELVNITSGSIVKRYASINVTIYA
jgi:hypothetical protein